MSYSPFRNPIRYLNNAIHRMLTARRDRRLQQLTWYVGDQVVPYDEIPGWVIARADITRKRDVPWRVRFSGMFERRRS